MKDIKIFSNPQFGEIRTVVNEQGEPMFCAKDVATALGYADTADAISRHCKSGNKVFHPHANGFGGVNMVYITEKDVYRLIMRSNLPDEEKFQDWVCDEVLPSIRKHGAYMTQSVIERTLTDPDYLIQLATALKEERQQRLIAEQKAQFEADINKANALKVLFADAVVGSKSTCLIGELAKIISQNGYPIGQNRLFKWLRDKGYLGKHGERYNIPNQQYIEKGLFELKKNVHSENGVMKTTMTPKVTGKGQQYFINKFLCR